MKHVCKPLTSGFQCTAFKHPRAYAYRLVGCDMLEQGAVAIIRASLLKKLPVDHAGCHDAYYTRETDLAIAALEGETIITRKEQLFTDKKKGRR